MPNQIPNFVIEAAQNDVGPSIKFTKEEGVIYLFHTGMKSDLSVFKVKDTWVGLTRYEDKYEIKSWEDLVFAITKCKYGRDYLSTAWAEVLMLKL